MSKVFVGIHCRKGTFPTITHAIEDKFKYCVLKSNSKRSNSKRSNSSKKNKYYALINTVQIYTHGPQDTHLHKINNQVIKAMMNKYNAKLFIHTTFKTYPWKNTSYMLSHSNSQIKIANKLQADGIIFHLPQLTATKIPHILKKLIVFNKEAGVNNTRILLEMIAQRPSSYSYETPEKINKLIIQLKKHQISSDIVGICIDTAHIFVNKTSVKIRKYCDAKKYLNKLESQYIGLFHINGNTRSGFSDCHTLPFANDDLIWRGISYSKSGLRAFVEYAKKHNIPIILEIQFNKVLLSDLKKLLKKIHS